MIKAPPDMRLLCGRPSAMSVHSPIELAYAVEKRIPR
jgi:hypothetical protein